MRHRRQTMFTKFLIHHTRVYINVTIDPPFSSRNYIFVTTIFVYVPIECTAPLNIINIPHKIENINITSS